MSHVYHLITDPTSTALVTGAYAIVIDKKTGKVKKIVWEKEPPGGWKLEKKLGALDATASFLETTQDMRGAEELQVQAGKLLASLTAEVEAETKAAIQHDRVAA